jgi:hypothetical protein
MPTIQIEADLSSEQLLSAARQLPRREFDQFVLRVLNLRAERGAPLLPAAESELLLKINHPVSDDLQHRYDELIARRDKRTLTLEEHEELLGLTDRIELLEAERMSHLIELAQLRQITLEELMNQLGLQPPFYA